ncbi:alpha-tocopherol transfer protein-like [Saccoglossus kowalevskii]|uniref:Alpha-tocopherol transfer protein-like n=1 Tax=Saccoglossus kowalevskii TaxID=10224 RepID=A0ABM0MF60_SACKO|nr:PREDICTED: alpha-tocopherol transfer protein-like [Saccoglossus kowalevskii]
MDEIEPGAMPFHDMIKSWLMISEILLLDENVQVNGLVSVVDHSGMTRKHLRYGTPSNMRMLIDVFENSTPIRVNSEHLLRQPDIFDIFFSVVKPLLTEKMKSRIHFHGEEFGTLHEYVPSAILPSEFGGQLEKFGNSEFVDKILAAEDYFIENSQYGFLKADEILGGESTANDPTTGITGSFKKLDVN